MEIRFLGHASLYLRTEDVSIVTDPWFSKDGAFLGSWFQFPDNTDIDISFLHDVDYVVLSHEHQDHFDLEFLSTLSASTRIVIPQYTDSYLRDALRDNLLNEVIVVPALQPVRLGDITLWPVVQSVPFWDDCTLIFETPIGVIIDANDMKIGASDLDWIKDKFPEPYLLAVQFSGATYYPNAYEMPFERKVAIAQQRVRSKFHGVKQLFESIGARYLLPFAGPACFLDESQFDLNFSPASIFPTQADFYRFAESEGFSNGTLLALPGEALEPGADPAARAAAVLAHPAFTDRRTYLEAYRDRRADAIRACIESLPEYEGSLLPAFDAFFRPLLEASPFFRSKIGGAVLFDITGQRPERVVVDFRTATNPCRQYDGEDVIYRLSIDGRIMARYLRRDLHFDQLLLSFRFSAHRDPDVFNEHLFMFLRFADPASYAQIEQYESKRAFEERFELEHEGRRLLVQRYCPHALGDLSRGEVVDGYLVCPNHGWRFSLTDGQGHGRDACIEIAELPENAEVGRSAG